MASLRLRLSSGALKLGMHDTLGGSQQSGFDALSVQMGQPPALWSGDFGFSLPSVDEVDDLTRREAQLQKMLSLGGRGVALTLSWHQCNPVMGEPCSFKAGVQAPLTESQWQELLVADSSLNRRWRASLAPLVRTLRALQDADIPVMLRPLHESNTPGMWWASVDPAQSVALYRMLHEELRVREGLRNLLWVWSVSYHPRTWSQMPAYYPGDDVVDVIGLDIYPPAKGQRPELGGPVSDLKRLGRTSKPLALSEVSRLPLPEEVDALGLKYVVPWGQNMLLRENSVDEIGAFYRAGAPPGSGSPRP